MIPSKLKSKRFAFNRKILTEGTKVDKMAADQLRSDLVNCRTLFPVVKTSVFPCRSEGKLYTFYG